MKSTAGPDECGASAGVGASGKTIVFGIFKRNGCVYTGVVPDCRKRTLQAVIRGRVALDTVIHSDGWRGYDGLIDVGYSKRISESIMLEPLLIYSVSRPAGEELLRESDTRQYELFHQC